MRYVMWFAIGSLTVTLSACLLSPVANHFRYSQQPFDSAKWKSGDARQRYRMAFHLMKSELLIGKSRHEVCELLGKGDRGEFDYDIIRGDVLGDALKFPFSGWIEHFSVQFDCDRVNTVRIWD